MTGRFTPARARRALAGAGLALGMAPIARVGAQETAPVRADTARAGAEPVRISADTLGAQDIAVDFGTGIGATTVRSLDATSVPVVDRRRRANGTTTQVRVVRRPDSLTTELARRLASGEHVARIDATLRGVHGGRSVLLRLLDVQLVSSRLTASNDDVALEQEVLALRESEAQMTADREELDRQLTAVQSLEARHLAAPLDVARARTSAEVLATRLEAMRARRALGERRLARWSPVLEELVLTAARVALETR